MFLLSFHVAEGVTCNLKTMHYINLHRSITWKTKQQYYPLDMNKVNIYLQLFSWLVQCLGKIQFDTPFKMKFIQLRTSEGIEFPKDYIMLTWRDWKDTHRFYNEMYINIYAKMSFCAIIDKPFVSDKFSPKVDRNMFLNTLRAGVRYIRTSISG